MDGPPVPPGTPADATGRRHPKSLPSDVEKLPWAAEQLHVSNSTAYRMAQAGEMPGAFKVRGQWRISTVRFWREVNGDGDIGARILANARHEDADG